MTMWNLKKMSDRVRSERQKEADDLLLFAAHLAKLQVSENRYFILEHPSTASSWEHPAIRELRDLPETRLSTFDQCRFGLHAPGDSTKLLQKSTRILSNSHACHVLFDGIRCQCSTPHVRIQGSHNGRGVSKHAAEYPPEMCRTLTEVVWREAFALGSWCSQGYGTHPIRFSSELRGSGWRGHPACTGVMLARLMQKKLAKIVCTSQGEREAEAEENSRQDKRGRETYSLPISTYIYLHARRLTMYRGCFLKSISSFIKDFCVGGLSPVVWLTWDSGMLWLWSCLSIWLVPYAPDWLTIHEQIVVIWFSFMSIEIQKSFPNLWSNKNEVLLRSDI